MASSSSDHFLAVLARKHGFVRVEMEIEQVGSLPVPDLMDLLKVESHVAAFVRGECRAEVNRRKKRNVEAMRKNLFKPYKTGSPKKSNAVENSAAKKRRRGKKMTFFCLGKKNEGYPRKNEWAKYALAGLGRKAVFIPDMDLSPMRLRDLMESEFPKLRDGGGFIYMRATDGKNPVLEEIPCCTPDGYNPKILEDCGATMIYIRPLQDDLDTSPLPVSASPRMPSEQCKTCNKFFPVLILKDHLKTHTSSDGSEEESHYEGFKDCDQPKKKKARVNCKFEDTESDSDFAVSAPPPFIPTPVVKKQDVWISDDEILEILHDKDDSDIILDKALADSTVASFVWNEAAQQYPEDVYFPKDSAEATVTEAEIVEELNKLKIDALDDWKESRVKIFRQDALTSAIHTIAKPAFDWRGKLVAEFCRETGQDNGGLKREFLRLITRKLFQIDIFTGSTGAKNFCLIQRHLSERKYVFYGRLFAWILAQGASCPCQFTESTYELMKTLAPIKEALVERPIELMDGELRDVAMKVREAATQQELKKICLDHGDLVIDMMGNATIQLTEKSVFLDCISKHYYNRTLPAVEQFCEGMNMVGRLHDKIRAAPSVFCHVMTEKGRRALTPNILLELLDFRFSEEGTNDREAETHTAGWFELWLETGNLNDFLVFATGCDTLPPGGLEKKIEICFFDKHHSDFTSERTRRGRVTWASTCSLQMHLPRGVRTPGEMEAEMSVAFTNGKAGFLKC